MPHPQKFGTAATSKPAQPKCCVTARVQNRPRVPPVYRPQSALQPLRSVPPLVPAVYRPQPVSRLRGAIQQTHERGVPHSKDAETFYLTKKIEKQKRMAHGFTTSPSSPLQTDATLAATITGHLETATKPNQLACKLYVDGQEVPKEPAPPQFVQLFKITGGQESAVHTMSEKDAEVECLAQALETFRIALAQRSLGVRTHHHLVLIGPCGACDSCKERMKLFKQRWHDLANRHGFQGMKSATLYMSYIFKENKDTHRHVPQLHGKPRNVQDVYGWKEAVPIEIGDEEFKIRQHRKRVGYETTHKHPSPFL